MEDNKVSSCLMLAVGLYTPVDLSCLFEPEDLKDTGVEFDSHITLFYSQGNIIPYENLLSDIKTVLGDDWNSFNKTMMTTNQRDVIDFFELSSFENDSDYIILKLKKETDLYDRLRTINKGLRSKYNIKSTFNEYIPHITLAELKPGYASKYLNSPNLELVLKDSKVDIEDFMISYNEKQRFLTNYKCVDRYFRLQEIKREREELDKAE